MGPRLDEIEAPRPSTPTMRWCRLTVTGREGAVLAQVDLGGSGAPDLAVVDTVARYALLAGRLRATVVLRDAAPELLELLGLAGLCVEVEREPEGGEQALRLEEVEEEGHPPDAAT
jgi:hypothetical protein